MEAAAAAAGTAAEATDAEKDAAVAVAAAALNTKEAAAAASAAALNRSGDADDDVGSVDLIGRRPLHYRLSAAHQGSCPLWRSAPLNLVVDKELNSGDHAMAGLISKILSVHPGPARRFSLCLSLSEFYGKVKAWLSSQALDKLQEFELIPERRFTVRDKFAMLPSCVYRFAPTLRVAKFGGCRFPDLIVKLSLKFPCLKQLTLDRVTISEGTLRSMLSGCDALESLELKKNSGFRRLCISSQTLKSIGFCTNWYTEGVSLLELVIQDAPCLEILLALDPGVGPRTVRVISAPKLNILGVLSDGIAELQLGTTVFQSMIAVDLTTEMHNVRVLVLDFLGMSTDLETLVNFLKCFPGLERLHAFLPSRIGISDPREYVPPEPIECLELHLEEVLLKNYDGTTSLCIDFGKFFVLNAKVLKEMKITLPYHRQYNWFANQHRLLLTKDRASRDARIEMRCGTRGYFTDNRNPMICQWLILLTCPPADAKSVVGPHFEDCLVFCSKPTFRVLMV